MAPRDLGNVGSRNRLERKIEGPEREFRTLVSALSIPEFGEVACDDSVQHRGEQLDHGNPMWEIAPHEGDRLARFMAKIDYSGPGGCWNWAGAVSCWGYGRFSVGGAEVGAHRFSYAAWRGELTPGLHIDHLCRNRRCVNPEHLELVTPRENVLRGESFAAANAAKQQCTRGHVLVAGNLYLYRGKRGCKACRSRNRSNYRNRQKIQAVEA